ncbi:MAG TPA: TonB-dependent receptor [Terriglobales bacterium]|nr:TonB-dependent receptor [Terriglobales bacterium]
MWQLEKKSASTLWLFLCAIALYLPVSLHGEHFTGELRLTVKDPSGALIEATGRLVNLTTGEARNFQTDARGANVFGNLPLGRYRLEVSKEQFATQSVVVEIQTATAVERVVTMALAPVASTVTIVGTTPLPGVDLLREQMPYPVQGGSAADIENSGALALSDFLNLRLSGIHVNEIQGNPYQPDINYRGYTASPLLGTPQGLSVYMDGVRLNQPFGDVVSWDLIPRLAISEVTLLPSSNPLFGLNTLGGALSIQTKDGRSQPGMDLKLTGGSFGRITGDLEYGGSNSKGLNWYTASTLFFEDGWRSSSPSNVRQFFGKLGWQRRKTTLGLTLAYANNSLIGNGLQDQRFLSRDYGSIYTKPDVTANRSPLINLSVRHAASNSLTLSGNFYYRYIRTSTLNGDINDDSLDQQVYQPNATERAALTAAGYKGFPLSGENASNTPFPSWRCIAQVLLRDEPGEKCNGLINRSSARQHNYGFSGQFTWWSRPGSQHNQFTAGAAYDRSKVDFTQSSQLGYLNPDRSITGLNAFADGVTGGDVDGAPFDTRVDLHGSPSTGSFYLTDTFTVNRALSMTFSGRYNRTTIENRDRILPAGGSGSLNGYNVFDRFNPAAGVTLNPWRFLGFYVSYSEGNRAPTSIELGCADPAQPCKLPNALAGDPPLNQIVTRTWEAGVRSGDDESRVSWSTGWFRGNNTNDILFVASQQTGFGYFKNFGQTRRQGFDLDANSRIWRFTVGGGYTFLDATFQSPELVDGSGNSTNKKALAGVPGVESTIAIQPGAGIPLIPQHMVKAFADLRATSRFSLSISMVAASSSYARGNENNQHQPDGRFYLGEGTSSGYGIVNLGGRYQVHPRVQIFAQINNLLNTHYDTAAQLAATGFTDTGAFAARPFPAVNGEFPLRSATFSAPGAPIGAWGGVKFKLF